MRAVDAALSVFLASQYYLGSFTVFRSHTLTKDPTLRTQGALIAGWCLPSNFCRDIVFSWRNILEREAT